MYIYENTYIYHMFAYISINTYIQIYTYTFKWTQLSFQKGIRQFCLSHTHILSPTLLQTLSFCLSLIRSSSLALSIIPPPQPALFPCAPTLTELTRTCANSQALADAERCVFLKPSWATGHMLKGRVHEAMESWDPMLTACCSAYDLDPHNVSILISLSLSLSRTFHLSSSLSLSRPVFLSLCLSAYSLLLGL